MGWFLLFGLFCLLAVVGFFVSAHPFKFAVGGLVSLAAAVFVALIVWVLWALVSPCTAPFNDCQFNAQVVSSSTQGTDFTPYTPSPSAYTSGQAPVSAIAASSTGTLPAVVGQCDGTTITEIGTRLTDGTTGLAVPGSGSEIQYADGGVQVSYDTIQGISDSQVGDRVNLCLVSLPTDCPPGDDRGIVYQATNLRTGESWTAQDSEHSCGGA